MNDKNKSDADNGIEFEELFKIELEEIKQARGRYNRGLENAGSAADHATSDKPEGAPPTDDPHSKAESAANNRKSDCYTKADDMRLMGLALSGGGIRSATFGLGVLEALAELKLLKYFDYLSTVSGGGYIGSWLSAWIMHESPKPPDPTTHSQKDTRSANQPMDSESKATSETEEPSTVIGKIEQELASSATHRGSRGTGREAPQIGFLREYSNYLTPQSGFFSGDTWTSISTYSRNFSITFLILVLALAALLLLPRVIIFLSPALPGETEGGNWNFYTAAWVVLAGAGIFLCLRQAMGTIGDNLQAVSGQGDDQTPSSHPDDPVQVHKTGGDKKKEQPRSNDTAQVQRTVVVPILLSAFLVNILWLSLRGTQAVPPVWSSAIFAAGGAALYWALFSLAWKPECTQTSTKKPVTEDQKDELTLASIFAGLVGGLLVYVLVAWAQSVPPVLVLTWGPPLMIFVALATVTAHLALIGRLLGAEVHEWLLRLGGWLSIYTFGWVAIFFFALYSPYFFHKVQADWIRQGLGIGWALSTLAGILAGRSGVTGGKDGKSWLEPIAKIAPFIFIVGLLGFLSLGINEILSGDTTEKCFAEYARGAKVNESQPCYWKTISNSGWQALLLLAVSGLLLWRFASVDINLFSLHYFYRNRLIRCYLGASRQTPEDGKPIKEAPKCPTQPLIQNNDLGAKSGGGFKDRANSSDSSESRKPNPFTGFDGNDDPKLRDIWTGQGPYHIVNTALNLVGGTNLAWQQRKACSFVFTPKGYGFEPGQQDGAAGKGGYRMIPKGDAQGEAENPSLGAALAISGAAFSPNMGYHSSPAAAFLMAVFNVRLGYWFRNPLTSGKDLGFANLPYLIYELLGLTDDKKEYVYLSDGGHFENLGIYELVRRRCRYIVAVDAGQDGSFGFEDLGNAIRKCQVDLGIDIQIDPSSLIPKPGSRWSDRHCAVGTIYYPDEESGRFRRGTLLYLKPSLSGREPADILEYAGSHAMFPHETTVDQWFDESQFESYRKLGYHVGKECLETVRQRFQEDASQDPKEYLFAALRQYWAPSTRIPKDLFVKHGQALSDLMDRLARDERLRFLDAEVYPEWHALEGTFGSSPSRQTKDRWPVTEDQGQAGFYFCNSMIQLAENVYFDLDLEAYWDHPDNRGWINLFRHWAGSDMLRKTWAISAPTYGARFQVFCQHRFGFPNQSVVTVENEILLNLKSDIQMDHGDSLHNARKENLLNDVEIGLIRAILNDERNSNVFSQQNVKVIPLQLDVPQLVGTKQPDQGPLLRFTFGFALVVGNKIGYFRIQDHLRKAGLGRRALVKLCEEEKVDQITEKDNVELKVPPHAYEVPTEEDKERFRILLRSVSFLVKD